MLVEPLGESGDLALEVREVQVHSAHRDPGTDRGLAGGQRVASGVGQLLHERVEDRAAGRGGLRLTLGTDIASGLAHMTNSISWLAATRTTPAMSGGSISTSFATSAKNAAASPFVVMVRKWTSVTLR